MTESKYLLFAAAVLAVSLISMPAQAWIAYRGGYPGAVARPPGAYGYGYGGAYGAAPGWSDARPAYPGYTYPQAGWNYRPPAYSPPPASYGRPYPYGPGSYQGPYGGYGSWNR